MIDNSTSPKTAINYLWGALTLEQQEIFTYGDLNFTIGENCTTQECTGTKQKNTVRLFRDSFFEFAIPLLATNFKSIKSCNI